MKKYKEYMDGVKAPDTLHQKLVELETPAKRPMTWKRYGTMAAALALVCGLGGFAAWAAHINGQTGPIPLYPSGYQGTNPEIADEPVPDIALVSPGDVVEPGQKTLGGYEVTSGSGGNAMTTYYILPFIDYGKTKGAETAGQTSLDWDIPQGATRRELTGDEIISLLGGEDAVNTHLDWGGCELTGWAAWYEDGSFWGAYLYGYEGPLDHFEFAVTAGHLPPTCIGYPHSVTQEIRGLTVTADGYDGKNGCDRRVSFMKDDYGYRFDLTSTDVEQAELLVSRLVCRIADKGLNLDGTGVVAMSPPTPGEDGLYTCEICGRDYPVGSAHGHPFMGVGEPNYEDGVSDYDSDCPYCADGTAHTHPYNPNGTADPQDDAPPVSVSDSPRSRGEDWCGNSDAMCSGYPVPEVCSICGETFPAGTDHSHEVCHLPLAPAARTCEVCGQTLPEGIEHSHQTEHHEEEHHSSHH